MFTLDNIASCLFGIETNSLQNENVTLINYLKKFFNRGLSNIILFIYCKYFSTKMTILTFLYFKIVISPQLAKYFGKKGYSMFPKDAVDYTTNLLNQILARRRQHLERRNDFIQMMIDHEEEASHEQNQTDKQERWGTLKKSRNKIYYWSVNLIFDFSFE